MPTLAPAKFASLALLVLLVACSADRDVLPPKILTHSFANSEWSEPVHLDAPVDSSARELGAGCPLDSTVRTNWPVETDLLLRKTFQLPSGVSRVKIRVAIDDEVQIFVNGVDVTASGVPNRLERGFQRHGEGCAQRDSFLFAVPDGMLHLGSNLLAVRARDGGGISYADLKVTGERN